MTYQRDYQLYFNHIDRREADTKQIINAIIHEGIGEIKLKKRLMIEKGGIKMPRHNRPRNRRPSLEDRFDTDVCALPRHIHIDRVICIPLKTIFRNTEAAPWGQDVYTARDIDDPIMLRIMDQM